MEFIQEYFFDFGLMGSEFDRILDGFWVTLKLAVLSGVLSLIWGLILAVLRQLPGRALAPIRWLTIAYIDIFRGIPLLLVLFLVSGFLSAAQAEDVIPRSIGLPEWFGEETWFWYGVISLVLTYGAYMAEVYRGARLLLGPSIWPEPFGRVFAEAAALGCPSVAFDSGGIREALGAGGRLLPRSAGVEDWIRTVRDLDEPAAYEELRSAALDHARDLAAARGIQRAVTLLEEAARKGHPRPEA